MAKIPEGRATLTDEQMIGLTHLLVDACIDCKGRIEELEAKLAVAEDFIRRLERFAVQSKDAFLIEKAQEALAELTGGKNE